ncbi:MAG: type II toxin-antitoxin system RelE/ParE family toxin [Methylomonas sp.]|nr:type II toxin-antitoxin system RelE/ParE family toxin [Methylomonas sp.]
MIKSFRHKGIQEFFESGSKSGINDEHAPKLSRQLLLLNAAKSPQEMDVAGWKLHPLKGDLVEHWAVKVSGNWRITFMFEGEDAVLVDYQDYH